MTPLIRRAQLFQTIQIVACSLTFTACAQFVPQPGPAAEPSANYENLTLPIVVVGDTQEHLSTGFPLHDNDSSVDAYVEVAQRPPQQPLFGRRILEWALRNHPTEPFLHLGDVLDLSCRVEVQRMGRIFEDAGRPGAVLPGNHDGLMFGIYGYNILDNILDSDARKWNNACRRGAAPDDLRHRSTSEALSKRGFIADYLSRQARLPANAALPLATESGKQSVSWRNSDANAYLVAVEAKLLDGYEYANSYVAQLLRLPAAPGATRRVYIVGIDTNQAGALVSTWATLTGNSPGSVGHVRSDQVEAIRSWVTEAATNGDIVVFAGHHNWASLGLPSRLLLRNLMNSLPHPLVYLSGHTHRGFWAEHRSLDRRPLLELNMSSLSDWPIAYRRLSFAYDEKLKRLLVRGELSPRGSSAIESDVELLAAWHTQTCERAGISAAEIDSVDVELVERQRSARGTMLSWLVEYLSPVCDRCELPMYEHAHAYQDELLDALVQIDKHIPRHVHRLYEIKLPEWCGAVDFSACARQLQAQTALTLNESKESFRRKATLVATINDHLDELTSPEARAYMTCRAVQSANLDFRSTPDDRNSNRGEAKRRLEQYFRGEASVGME